MLLKKKPFLEIILLLIISAIVYLPNIGNLTYFKDDWYYIYDGTIAGADIFHLMFSIDRPARGVFFEIYYSLFGPHPLPYHIAAYLWRALSSVGALWLFNILWPRERKFAFFTALFFTIYPGYFWWISAIEYQPMIASLALQVFSIAFTLKAVQASGRAHRVAYLAAAVLTGWLYIALVDYAIGMEVMRFLCVYVIVERDRPAGNFFPKLLVSARAWMWNLIIPLGFVFWRIFIFNNERKATDIGLQLSALMGDPVSTLTRWLIQWFNSLLNLGVLAWVAQFPRFFFGLRLRDTILGLTVAVIVLLLVLWAEKLLGAGNGPGSPALIYREAFLIGLPGMMLGILPVIMANRTINLEGFSHYALPASLAAAVSLAGFLHTMSSRRVRWVCLSGIVAFAALAHYSISVSAMNEEDAVEEFWWQVSWRIPALRPGTTLVINYPSANMGDDGFGVMEAANMIYFPQPSAQIPVHYNVSAITLSNANLQDVLTGNLHRQTEYRSHTIDFDYGNVLVLSQPASTSCVHVMDGRQPLISPLDPGNVLLAAPSSNIENVITDSAPFIPPDFAFGPEPGRKWCYYYEKAELALQFGDWDEVVSLGNEAIRLGLHPEDQSEWMPFLQAYAITGDEKGMKQTASKINTDVSLRVQACDRLTHLEVPLKPEIQELVSTLYCRREN
ncbi:MAG: hypothetical protein HZB19_07575 [Chloroflexi bacterium]|nr:hypothetical protein [Chloroflexota bacterium]